MQALFLAMFVAYAIGALAALAGGRKSLGRGLVALGGIAGAGAGLALGATVIATGIPFALSFPELLPLGGGLALRLDSLGAFFLVVIGIGAIPAAIYGASYSAAYEDGRASLRLLGTMFNLFLLTMSLVTLADNVLTFLLMWEGMSLTSYFLVMTEAGEESTRNAGLWYIGMTHAGLVMLLAAFLLLTAGTGSGSFADLRASAASLSAGVRDAAFVLAFLGFGSKAGIVPLHVWLPRAHPAAPSHVSALLSGVMIKMGVYGLVRVALDLLGGGATWWGGLVLGVGAVSALLGVLYALMEHDLKRLLAFHSVENIGIILIGIGAGLMFHRYGLMSLAALGFIGGLYHVLNHATFKGLLFLGAGSVLHGVHTRNMEQMGGLIKRMPWTALFFLIGAAAISALPPLNGFVSEWLVFQSLLAGVNVPVPEVAVVMPVAVGLLALTSGLAAACFVKAFGITFLALPRSSEAAHAHESPFLMRFGMGLLALACIGLGVAPGAVVPVLGRILAGIGGLPDTRAEFTLSVFLQTPSVFGQMSPTLMAFGLLLLIALAPSVLWLLRLTSERRLSDSWGCGRVGQTARMEYTATAFAEPLKRVFAEIYRPMKELTVDFHPESKYFVQSIEYRNEITPWFDQSLYRPFLQSATFIAQQVRRLQAGSLHLYLLYIAIVLTLLLVVARWF
ncbi:MAG: hydrogenase 4 subunit B [Deltaproteobacteria bacterium]|nr:hydrogenase 4 subunit B [Deltaproteobacteria bacterium]